MFFACIDSVPDMAELGFANSAARMDELPPAEGETVLRVSQPGTHANDLVFAGPGLCDVTRLCAEFGLVHDDALRALYVAL